VANLFEQFLSETIERLAFLIERYGYACTSESGAWFAQVSFSRPDSSIRLFYGDREFSGSVIVARSLRGRLESSEYGLWEWLDALQVANPPKTDVAWIQTPNQLSAFLADVSGALDLYLPQILRAGPEVTARLEQSRADRDLREQEERAQQDHRSASARASEAFRAHQYDRVVELLEPFHFRLSKAESKKLAYAKKRLAFGAG
jgi:hypothetical protein